MCCKQTKQTKLNTTASNCNENRMEKRKSHSTCSLLVSQQYVVLNRVNALILSVISATKTSLEPISWKI